MSDGFIRRDGDDYAEAFARLLPRGEAWSRDPDGDLMRLVRGQAEIWGAVVDPRAADLLELELDPRFTTELLPDWERAFGLPDPCVQEQYTLEERRLALIERITTEGGQSRAFFYNVASRLGYVIRIVEYSPFMAGISRCGDTRATGTNGEQYRWQVGPPEIRFYWTVRVYGSRVSWFRAGAGQCGIDPMVRFSMAMDLECLFRRYKPAHTEILFDYANVTPKYQEYVPFRAGVNHCGTDPLLTIIEHGGDPLPAESVPLY
ncbi:MULTISPECIES: YmfQ family protein [Methylobacterium]|uniref:Uncharacterized protein YmfQ (DUF2313 family) n=2 Tax=Methylobacteriaceae TaxID=119045 RepID=A0ABV2NPP9_9HYPH|nr:MULTISPECIES: putative phage tail protein [unclassified Methylobacterium]MBP2494929.1 uncharacterized protein YmfQ (DUF2313 family) [Methylobacterium sp. PvP105]MBP2505200.1 uncharacterized protein YmfQ (DUF2313 family) [Methylobacterium sp. PvP109]